MGKNLFLATVLTVLVCQSALAQKEGNMWYFGNAAAISFNATGKPVALTNSQMVTGEGSASIASSAGRLMFYTDGIKIWDSSHNVMSNGSGLNGNSSSTQSDVIVPRPDSAHVFYVFTVDELAGSKGFCYSEVNMTLSSGKGNVVSARKNVFLTKPTCEKITAVKHANGKDYWVLTHKYLTDTIYAYLVTASGVNSTPIKSKTGIRIAVNTTLTRGNMKASPDGTKISYVSWALDSTVMADFNATTGVVSNAWTVFNPVGYGCEFSPKSKYLYATELNNKKIFQYDAKAISRSAFRASKKCIDSGFSSLCASLQLGPDGKIYVSEYNVTYLHVLHAPDSFGFACRPQRNYVYLSGKGTYYGLPTFIQSYFQKKVFQYTRNCLKDSTFFTISDFNNLDSVKWIFGDSASGVNNISKKTTNISHIYNKTGYYTVSLISYFKLLKDTTKIKIYVKDPKPFIGKDTSVCNSISLTVGPVKNYLTYKWNTGPTNKTISVTQKGTYIVTVKDSVACFSADTIVVSNPQLKAAFKLSDTIRCFKGNLFSVKDTSKYKDDSWKKSTWYFGDGTQKIDTLAKKYYTTDTGKFIITLVLHSKANCKDSTSKSIMIFPNAKIGFNINKNNQCLKGHSYNFSNISTVSKGTISNSWLFGDDSSSLQKDITGKKFVKDSSYAVRLITNTDKNCRDTMSKTVIVYPNASVIFTPSKTTQCYRNNLTNFVNSTTIRIGAITTYAWNFGDNTTSSQKDIISKVYTTADSFKVSLLVISDKGCRDSIKMTVFVWASSVPGFTVNQPNQCFNGHGYNFSNSSRISQGTITYSWLFGDDSMGTQKDISAKKYLKDSSYSVRLITTTDKNCKDTIIKNVIVYPNTKIGFTPSKISQCFNYNSTNFTNTSSIRTGTVFSYNWNFGDNTTSAQKNVSSKTYSSADSFKVSLLAISDKGCRDSIKKTVFVWANSMPGFNINQRNQCFKGHTYSFVNTSTISQGIITNSWLFGDDSSSVQKDIGNKTYLKDSSYSVRLITTSDRNCTDTISKTVIVYPNSKLSFTPSKITQCFNHNSINFANNSTIRTDSIVTHSWNFGDNTSSLQKNISNKVYNSADSFVVSLLTISAKGCRDSLSKTILVYPNTFVNFSINKDTQCYEWNSFDYTNNSTLSKGSVSYIWDLADTKTDTAKHIIDKKYALFGTYNVRLIASTDKNCRDTITKKVVVHASPVAKFTIDKDMQCFRNNLFNFTNTTSINDGSVVSQNWNLDNGQNKTSQHVLNYKYATEDSFDVELISLSDKRCYDTVSQLVVTYAQPVAKYTIPNDSQCWQKHFFNIINQSTLKYGKMSHTWNFGDGTFDYDPVPLTKKYANKSAKYTVRYKLVSDHGCTDSLNHNINLLERPISTFDINDSVQCFRSHLFSFTNKTIFSAMNTLTYFWDYGNGSASSGITPQTATYAKAQYYPVSLTSYSYLTNCYDTLITMVLPAPQAVPGFIVGKDSQCLRFNQFNFTNQSTLAFGTMTYKWDFKDASGSGVKDPVKHYTTNAISHKVKLIVTTNHNCKDSLEKPIILIPQPKAAFSINDTSQCLNLHGFDLLNSSTLSYGSYTSMWLFDDSTNNTNKDVNAKKFNSWGKHKVTLTVNSSYNCTDTSSRWVYLENPRSTKIQLPDKDSQCLRGNRFNFSALSTDPNVKYVSYSWDYGDGNTAISNPAFHRFTKDGQMKILLETVSANGCKDTGYFNVIVHPHPVTSFMASSACFPDSVVFTNTSSIFSGDIVSYTWDHGDGSSSNLQQPARKYSQPGYYDISLITRSERGCNDTLIKTGAAWVRKKPVARFDFTTLPSKEFQLTSLQLNNQSSDIIILSNWDFGNGLTSADKEPIAEYRDSNSRLITLVVTNDENCLDTFTLETGQMITDFFFHLANAFSPNQNGTNEEFKPVASPYIYYYVMEIFNRWGEKVFATNDITKGWDGTYMGEKCQEGVYLCRVYVVPLKGKMQSHEITITLLR